MKTTFTVTKPELDLLLRGIRAVLVEENTKSMRRSSGYHPTNKLLAAGVLEVRLSKAFDLLKAAKEARACRRSN
jgi:hypothetical protein